MEKSPPGHKFYVYNYLDVRPGREGEVLYVGKGTYSKREGFRRMESHWKRRTELKNKLLSNVLHKIHDLSLEPVRVVASWHLTEDEAFAAEMSGVSQYRLRKHGGTLCNLSFGGEGPNGLVHGACALMAISERTKELWADPGYVIRRGAAARAGMATPEGKANKAAASKRRWQDPEFKAKNSAAIKAARSTPEARAQTSETNKKIWADPNAKAAFSARMKEVLNNPAEKARKSAVTRAKWQDPEFRAKMAAAREKRKTT